MTRRVVSEVSLTPGLAERLLAAIEELEAREAADPETDCPTSARPCHYCNGGNR